MVYTIRYNRLIIIKNIDNLVKNFRKTFDKPKTHDTIKLF